MKWTMDDCLELAREFASSAWSGLIFYKLALAPDWLISLIGSFEKQAKSLSRPRLPVKHCEAENASRKQTKTQFRYQATRTWHIILFLRFAFASEAQAVVRFRLL